MPTVRSAAARPASTAATMGGLFRSARKPRFAASRKSVESLFISCCTADFVGSRMPDHFQKHVRFPNAPTAQYSSWQRHSPSTQSVAPRHVPHPTHLQVPPVFEAHGGLHAYFELSAHASSWHTHFESTQSTEPRSELHGRFAHVPVVSLPHVLTHSPFTEQ